MAKIFGHLHFDFDRAKKTQNLRSGEANSYRKPGVNGSFLSGVGRIRGRSTGRHGETMKQKSLQMAKIVGPLQLACNWVK